MAEHMASASVMMRSIATTLFAIMAIMCPAGVVKSHNALVVRILTSRCLRSEGRREHRRQHNGEQKVGYFS